MTRYVALTTCNAEQWRKHGRAMAATYKRHWPIEVPLLIYSEGFDGGALGIDLERAAPWLVEFKARHRDQRYRGGPGGRDYRHDAVRFAHKVAAIGAAAEYVECDVLIWLDADTVTFAPVTGEWLDSLFPEPAVVAWLDRDHAYPECGWLMFRMPAARAVIAQVVETYQTGELFKLREWHDSFVFEHVVKRAGVPVHSLSGPAGRRHTGHPWLGSPLAEVADHLKGEVRRDLGRSTVPAELRGLRTEAYWR